MKTIALALLILTSCNQDETKALLDDHAAAIAHLANELDSVNDELEAKVTELESEVEALEARIGECSCAN